MWFDDLRAAWARLAPSGVRPSAYAVVVIAAVCQTATILLTWDLWQGRDNPPTLPVFDGLANVGWAPLLLFLAMVTIVAPRKVAPVFCAAYLLAALGDQTRLQPEVVSLAVLMTAPLYGEHGITVARWHVTTLWTWAGIHKALSLGWSTGGAGFIATSLGDPSVRSLVAFGLPAIEISIGVASVFRRAWPVVRWAGCALNLGIFLTLSPLFGDWNSSVWPWNIGLALGAVFLFSGRSRVAPNLASQAIVVLLATYPALFYVGLVDAYLAHNLYTSNTATASICSSSQQCVATPFDTWDALNVPLPPEERLYRAWFDRICVPGSTLVVTGPQTRLTDPPKVHRYTCKISDA